MELHDSTRHHSAFSPGAAGHRGEGMGMIEEGLNKGEAGA